MGRGPQRDKPFRDALRMEAALTEQGQPTPGLPGSLRAIARALLLRSMYCTTSAKEVADRLDGKVPQAVVGSDDEPPVQTKTEVIWTVVDPRKDT